MVRPTKTSYVNPTNSTIYSFLAFLSYLAIALVAFRFNFSISGFPAGTNSLGTYAIATYYQQHQLDTWYSLTDWGQPYPGFTGPTLFYPLALILNPGLFVRIVEFIPFLLAGITSYYVSLKLVRNSFAAFVGGLYYMLMIQTGQFFEGHIGLLVVFSLLPIFFYLIYRVVTEPKIKTVTLLAIVLYVFSSVGDLSGLYFSLFFGVPASIYFAIRRLKESGWYSPNDLIIFLYGVFLFISLMLSWALPYFYGLKPEYTTAIVSKISPFAEISGISPLYSIIGFIGDNSYTYFGHGHFTYSIIGGPFLILYGVIPVLITAYVKKRKKPVLKILYLVALFSITIASGALVPGVKYLNFAFYEYVPFFNTIPSVFRWVVFVVLAYSVIIPYMVKDLIEILRSEDPNIKSVGRTHVSRYLFIWKNANKKSIAVALLVVIIAVPVLQNFELFTIPPQSFDFPLNYTEGYSSIAGDPYGNVLTVPFGSIYERTPWGVVSQSSEFVSPFYSGKNVVLFEAGTSYSRAMDYFIGNGMTYGYTNNITKYLQSTNVKYIVTTKYQNWTYSSGPSYIPSESYYAFENQTNRGQEIFNSSIQKVYSLPNAASNVSFSSTYYVYFGNNSLLYEILNQPWYKGAQTPLINGASISSQENSVFEHAKAIVVSPSTFKQLSTSLITKLGQIGVPIIFLMNYKDITIDSYKILPTQWKSSNGISFESLGSNNTMTLESGINVLKSYGYEKANLSIRAMMSENSYIKVSYKNQTVNYSTTSNGNHFQNYRLMNFSISNTGSFSILFAKKVSVDTFSIIAYPGNLNSNPAVLIKDNKAASTNSSYSFDFSSASSWGIIILAQTYNNLWNLTSSNEKYHVVSNIGINGWVVNATNGIFGKINFQGNVLLKKSLSIELIFLPLTIVFGVGIIFIRPGKNKHPKEV